MISEWDPILTTKGLEVYAEVRLNEDKIELRLRDSYIVKLDKRSVPQLIKALERIERHI